jgi:7-cyano-7-deazaguanine reductase
MHSEEKKNLNTSVLHADGAPLGKETTYVSIYTPELLFPILRKQKRDEIHVLSPLPFKGYDIWNAYELSWLNDKGKPEIAVAQFIFPCETSHIIESKSFKLYLNSYNNTKFSSMNAVKVSLENDLSKNAGLDVEVHLLAPHQFSNHIIRNFDGICLDPLDVNCDTYTVHADYLQIKNDKVVDETLYSDLLKSNCLVTGQPDWASIQIKYSGQQIDHKGLLKYIISYRNHNEFHEQCVERIFMDISTRCNPTSLTVYARYTRRGGLDINPIRSTENIEKINNFRMFRQ